MTAWQASGGRALFELVARLLDPPLPLLPYLARTPLRAPNVGFIALNTEGYFDGVEYGFDPGPGNFPYGFEVVPDALV